MNDDEYDDVSNPDDDNDGWGNDEDPYTEDEKDQAGSQEFFNSYD